MNISERIRYLRKEKLNITQEALGEPLGLTRANIANIEAGRISVTERVILGICEKFNINEEWLRTGNGEMFVPLSRDDEIAFAVGKLVQEDDSFKKKLISILLKMDESQWEVLEQIANELIKKD